METKINAGFQKVQATAVNTQIQENDFLLQPDTIILDKYRILSRLEVDSGEAVLYLCTDRGGRARYVAKIYLRKDAIKDEVIEKLSHLQSPNVVSYVDQGKYNGHTCLILPYFKNGSLAGKKFSFEFIQQVVVPCVNNGLKYLHQEQICHRDIKPSNLMLSDDQKSVLIIDFGISSTMDQGVSIIRTSTGMTPKYSAPETFNNIYLTHSDYYSFGICLYELFTGSVPFESKEVSDEDIASLASINAIPFATDFPNQLKKLILGLTYKDLTHRNEPDNPNRRWVGDDVDKWCQGQDLPIPGKAVVEYQSDDCIAFSSAYYFINTQGNPLQIKNLADFCEIFGTNWSEGKKHLGRGLVSNFFQKIGNGACYSLACDYEEGDGSDYAYFNFLLRLQSFLPNRSFYWHGCKYQDDIDFANYLVRTFIENHSSALATDENSRMQQLLQVKLAIGAIKLWYLSKQQPQKAELLDWIDKIGDERNFSAFHKVACVMCLLYQLQKIYFEKGGCWLNFESFVKDINAIKKKGGDKFLKFVEDNHLDLDCYVVCGSEAVSDCIKSVYKVYFQIRHKMQEKEQRALQKKERKIKRIGSIVRHSGLIVFLVGLIAVVVNWHYTGIWYDLQRYVQIILWLMFPVSLILWFVSTHLSAKTGGRDVDILTFFNFFVFFAVGMVLLAIAIISMLMGMGFLCDYILHVSPWWTFFAVALAFTILIFIGGGGKDNIIALYLTSVIFLGVCTAVAILIYYHLPYVKILTAIYDYVKFW